MHIKASTRALGTQDINVAANVANGPLAGKNGVKTMVDYSSVVDRPPVAAHIASVYYKEAYRQLSEDFPRFHKLDINTLLKQDNGLYAPTFVKCYDCTSRNAPVPTAFNRFVRTNATTRALPTNRDKCAVICQEFEAERLYVQDWKVQYDNKRTQKRKRASSVHELGAMRQELVEQWIAEKHFTGAPPPRVASSLRGLSEPSNDLGVPEGIPNTSIRIECGCCCDDSTSFIDMVQCPDGHLFCKDCVRMQAETVVGDRGTDILCMDQSNCKLPFALKILSECPDERTIALWEKIKQAKEIREANIQGLEDCPFCDYAVVIPYTAEQIPLFHCAKCREVSCRRCKRKNHRGQPCHDQVEDARLKTEHAVEEAMTQALLRTCPKCKAPFIKEHGCNKMKCQSCGIYSCYICRAQILDARPYDHFYGQGIIVPGKCPLWDGVGGADPKQRHEAEVAAAERAARAKLDAAQAGPSKNTASLPVFSPAYVQRLVPPYRQ